MGFRYSKHRPKSISAVIVFPKKVDRRNYLTLPSFHMGFSVLFDAFFLQIRLHRNNLAFCAEMYNLMYFQSIPSFRRLLKMIFSWLILTYFKVGILSAGQSCKKDPYGRSDLNHLHCI